MVIGNPSQKIEISRTYFLGGITERSISVAITATEHICRKDFSMDSDETHLRRAAHQMMRSMTAAMAAITCREPLTTTILGYLKQALINQLGNSNPGPDQTKMIEEATLAVTEANINAATNFVVKSACEKAVSEMEKRLENDFVLRRAARKANQPFQADIDVVTMSEKVPALIRVHQGAIPESMLKIYDDFSSYGAFSLFLHIHLFTNNRMENGNFVPRY